jgi:hypothetical protein
MLGYDLADLDDILFNVKVAKPVITTVIDSKGKIELLSHMELILNMFGLDPNAVCLC